MIAPEHTWGADCPLCLGERGTRGRCDQYKYSYRHTRFMLMPNHLAAWKTAYLNPDRRASSNEMARLKREEQTLPSGSPRHYGWCSGECPREDLSRGYPACKQCLELRRNQKTQEPAEFGRTGAVNAPMPSVEMLDLAAGWL